ncbi:MAG: hypothetical protein E7018_02110 [Alphaproteobacteria bacterium]|nr:hypothetical protein [Alphaproteobacteria bacterium]
MANISLTASMRSNLLSLQKTNSLMDLTQERLSTGKKVNSAIDNPSSFYTARSLNNRANDLDALLDSMGQGIQTIKAATTAIETATSFLEQAKAVANQTLETAQPVIARVKTEQELLAAVNSGQKGFIVLENDITMSDNQNIVLSDGQSLVGARFFDKTASQTTLNFNYDMAEDVAMESPIHVGNDTVISDLNINFLSNTRNNLGGDIVKEGGVIFVKNKKNVKVQNIDIKIDTSNANKQAAFYGVFSESGNVLVAGNLNITGTAALDRGIYSINGQLDVNDAKVNLSKLNMGIIASLDSEINVNGKSNICFKDTSLNLCAMAGSSINLNNDSCVNIATGYMIYTSHEDVCLNVNDNSQLNGDSDRFIYLSSGGNTKININDSAVLNVKESIASYSTAAVDLQINSSAASINLDVAMDRFNFSSVLGAQITTQDGTYTLDNNVDDELLNSANLAANGSLDVDKKAGFDAETIAMFADFEAYMAANNNAETDNNIENLEQFSDILNQYDDLIDDAKYKGVNLLKNETLKIKFNETGDAFLDVVGKDISAANIGLTTTEWITAEDVSRSIGELTSAIGQLRAFSGELGNNYSIVMNRQDFTENLINILTEGSDKLTLADMNEESANMLALQTRQQLAINALSLASQASQGVLKLF